MKETPKQFKRPPKKYQPKGLPIIYEDLDLLVVNKVCGLATVSNDKVGDHTAYYRLTDYVRKGNPKSKKRLFIVHRLDRDTSGVLVFAKSESAKRFLQDEWHSFSKIYHTIVHGKMPDNEGVITSYLDENSSFKMFSVDDKDKGKLAKTGYEVIKELDQYSLLEIDLLTGRKNQIRVHLSEKGCPVVGDKKYGIEGDGQKRLCLHASSITIKHPHSKEEITFSTKLPLHFELLMKKPKDK